MSEHYTNGVIVKESSQANSSSRIYYYNGASVPFLWETRPGTPKKDSLFSESFHLPPLTPPPSYYSSSSETKQSKVRTKQSRFVKTLFNGKHHVSRPSFSWSSTTSSSSSSSSFSSSPPPPSKAVPRATKCYLSCSRSLVKDDEEEIVRSPRSTLCCRRAGFSSSMGSMKRALCSVLSINGSSRKDLRLV